MRCEGKCTKDYLRSRGHDQKFAQCRRVAIYRTADGSHLCAEHVSLKLLPDALADGKIQKIVPPVGEKEYRAAPR